MRFTKINILKLIVLVGTFALAMAFAGNDLVNFIGVPLAGLASLKSFIASSVNDPLMFTMETLKAPVQTPTIFLLIAGLVMVSALWFSRKARSVTQTELRLSRQDEGKERFESSSIARHLVRNAVAFSKGFNIVLPRKFSIRIAKRFNQKAFKKRVKKEGISFDLVRASVNLVVASILVAFGTSLKLPLSTTYVTFMVAMGTSLADGAWGRESAVNRITGVLAVVGGWFITAFSAFFVAFLVALAIYYGGPFSIGILMVLAIFFVYKTHTLHKKKEKEEKLLEEIEILKVQSDGISVTESSDIIVVRAITSISRLYEQSVWGLINEKRKKLRKTCEEIQLFNDEVRNLNKDISKTISLLKESEIESGHHYIQLLDSLKEIAHCLLYMAQPIYEYVNDQRPPLFKAQKRNLTELSKDITDFLSSLAIVLKDQKYTKLDSIIMDQEGLDSNIIKLNKKHLKVMKRQGAGKRVSIIYLNTLTETKNLLLNIIKLIKAHKGFVEHSEQD
jgi:K+-sensing histidine kinase KdpD